MLTKTFRRLTPAALGATLLPCAYAQQSKPTTEFTLPVVVYDRKAPVTTLTPADFSLTVDGKPQTIRALTRAADLPLTLGILVDTSRSQTATLDEEQKATQTFLDTQLHPASSSTNAPATKAFILQFAHTAELLQDVTASPTLLATGLKEVGTQAPNAGDKDEDKDTTATNTPASTPSNNPNNNGGYGPYGRRNGYPGNSNPNNNPTTGSRSEHASSGDVLYDSIYLASNDVLGHLPGRRVLVILSSGVDRHSKESLNEALEAAQRTDTVVYAIYNRGRDESRGFGPRPGYGDYGGYNPYGYPPTTGGSTDPGTYRDPDGKKILDRICTETGGRVFEMKGKNSLNDIYTEIAGELRAGYRLSFTPSLEATGPGFHTIDLSLTNPADRKFEVATRKGYYTGATKPD